ncbi:protein chibby homolog 2 [Cuculus canorus]|uniref:protein chibby homolog 2 n=1 Tax=Cuculus canorus TaxID=55661 RepID=UPI0023AA7313|nr:protein chibby homolog 2 [Cuculus canorus]
MAAFDPTKQNMEHIQPKIDYVIPLMKLRDDMFVSVDGKWMNEIYCQPPFVSHQKLFSKKAQNEWSILEENRVLWEENHILWIENRMLREEIRALQYLQSQNKAVQVVDAIQQSLRKENKPFPFFQEMSIGFQTSSGNKALKEAQEDHRVLENIQQEHKTVPIIWEDKKATIVREENKDASLDLQKDTNTITDVEESNSGPMPQREHGAKKKNTSTSQNKIQCAPSMQKDSEILQTIQDLHKLLHIYAKENYLLEKNEDCHILYHVHRSFQKEYNKLKMQLNAVKNTVSGITAQMEMLETELIAITSPMKDKVGN